MKSESVPAGWARAQYGDALVEIDVRAGERLSLPVLSVTKTRGPMLASERFGKIMHGRDLSKYRVAPRHHIVADPMLLWDGSIGIQRVVDEGLVSPDYRVYAPTAVADPSFLAHVVRSPHVQAHYQGGARGTNVRRNRITRSDFLSIPLTLPPLVEQRQIATILSSVDDAMRSTKEVIDSLDVLRKAMLAELLARGLPRRHSTFQQTDIGYIPKDWDVVALGEAITALDAGWSPQCEARAASQNEWGVLKVSAVSSGEFREGENKSLPAAMTPRPEIEVHAGDIILSRANTPALVGRSVYVRRTRSRLLLSDKLLRLRPRHDRVDPRFLNFVLNAPASRSQIVDCATGSSKSMKNISQAKLQGVRIPLPAVAEQQDLMTLVDAVAARSNAEHESLFALRHLKSALGPALLTGGVRVRRDEEDA